MSKVAIPDVPYADPALFQFLLALKQRIEDSPIVDMTVPVNGTVWFGEGTGNYITFNTELDKFEFYRAGLLVSTV